MGGLVLKLRPHEELMINGVIVENGDRQTRIRVKTEGAHILRLKDAMRPEDATTPLKQAYYIAQLAVAGQIPASEATEILSRALDAAALPQPEQEIREAVSRGDFYQVMRMIGRIAVTDPKGSPPTP